MTRPATAINPSATSATVPVPERSWTLEQHRARPSWLNDARPATAAPTAPGRFPVNRTGVNRQPFSLAALLVCDSCDRPLQPVLLTGGRRGYRAPCGCRLSAVDAAVVERLVRDAVERHSVALVADVPAEALGGVFTALFAAVRIGGSSEDLSLVWRM